MVNQRLRSQTGNAQTGNSQTGDSQTGNSQTGDRAEAYGVERRQETCEVVIVASSEQVAACLLRFDSDGYLGRQSLRSAGQGAIDELTRSVNSVMAQTESGASVRVLNAEDFDEMVAMVWECTSTFVAVLDAGDWLEPDAIAQAMQVFQRDSQVELVYADHDYWSPNPDFLGNTGSRETGFSEPVLKPAWSPELLRSWNYLGPLTVMPTSFVRRCLKPTATGPGAGATIRLSLGLQAIEQASDVAHLAEVLAHRRLGSTAAQIDLATLGDHLRRCQLQCTPQATNLWTAFRSPDLMQNPLVSIIVLTGGASRTVGGRSMVLVENALQSVIDRSTYTKFEIIVVLDAKSDDELGRSLCNLDSKRIRTIKDDRPFNFSAANNLGAANAKGDLIIFLNDDTEVVTPQWIERLIMNLVESDVGVVGTQLRFGDGRIQHAGLVLRDGWVEHRLAGSDPQAQDRAGQTSHAGLERSCDVSAVTGACLAMRRSDFVEVGGFCVEFPLNFNDVDLCLRIRARGQRVVLDQSTVLLHLETSSRSAGITKDEQTLFQELWGEEASLDPFHNPNLTQVRIEHMVPPAALLRLRRLVANRQRAVLSADHVGQAQVPTSDRQLPFGKAPVRTVHQIWSTARSSWR